MKEKKYHSKKEVEDNEPWYFKNYNEKPVHTSQASDYMENKSAKPSTNNVSITPPSRYIVNRRTHIEFMSKCLQRLRRRN